MELELEGGTGDLAMIMYKGDVLHIVNSYY